MASTLTTFDFALKERYSPEKVETLCYSDRPLLAMLAKDTTLGGDVFVQPVIYGGPQGASGQLGASYMNKPRDGTGGNVSGAKFNVTIGEYFGNVVIGDKVIKASRGNVGAFLENKAAEMDMLYETMSDRMAKYLWSNGGNSIGLVAAGGISGQVVTLDNKEDILNFAVGMYIQADTVDGSSGTLHTGDTYVTAVNREDGKFTVNAVSDINNPTGLAAADYIFNLGDAGVTSTIVTGIGGWITSSSSPASLYGVTRTTDATYLAGVRVPTADLSGLGIEERLAKLVVRMTSRAKGPGPDAIFLNPENWQDLAIALQSRGVRPLEDKSTSFGFDAISLVAGGKTVKVYADRFAPEGTAFALKMGTWKLRSMGELFSPMNEDGLNMLRLVDANSYEFRLISYPALTCSAPGWNGRVPL